MIKQSLFVSSILSLVLLASCQPAIKPEQLYGKWKYVKVENPNAHPPDSVNSTTLEMEAPYILFTKNDSLAIYWSGKVLSHGQFRTDGQNIQYKETLPGGKTREFPFMVKKLTTSNIVFETSGEAGTKVTAVKE